MFCDTFPSILLCPGIVQYVNSSGARLSGNILVEFCELLFDARVSSRRVDLDESYDSLGRKIVL